MTLAAMAVATGAQAQTAGAQTAAPATTAAPAAKAAHYTTSSTEIGALLDDPAARALLDKHIPGMTSNPQVDMARAMTLKDVQQYSPDLITDKVLADLDADFANIPAKSTK
jgi:para-nitrobenzyl esterase